jgi:hypothetical protein
MKSNGEYLSRSLNPTLNYLRVQKALDRACVVAQDGSGNYTTIEAALASGAEVIYVRAGTYAPVGDLELDGQSLIGEGAANTTIRIGTDSSIIMKSSGAGTRYSTGTVTLTNTDETITGALTAWATGGTAPSTYAKPCLITNRGSFFGTVTNDTAFEAASKWNGPSSAGQAYVIADVECHGSELRGFKIEHVLVGANVEQLVKVTGLQNRIAENYFAGLAVYTNSVIRVAPTGSWALGTRIENNVLDGGQNGIEIIEGVDTLVEGNLVKSMSNTGMTVGSGGVLKPSHVRVLGNQFVGCEYGIGMDADCDEWKIVGNDFTTTRTSDIGIWGAVSGLVIEGNNLKNPGNAGSYSVSCTVAESEMRVIGNRCASTIYVKCSLSVSN